MVRGIIKLAVLAVLVNAAVNTVPVFWNYFKFRDKVEELAMWPGRKTERDIQQQVVALAAKFDIPLGPADVQVRRVKDHTYVEADYTAEIEYFPRRIYPWPFELRIDGVAPRYAAALP